MGLDILLLAAVAVFVFYRLFSVLGKQDGAAPPSFRQNEKIDPQPKSVHVVPDPDPESDDTLEGLQKIAHADPDFSQREFLTGAKTAYEMIVKAFADADYSTLKTLLTPEVFKDYENAIEARQAANEEPLELMRLKDATIESGDIVNGVAEISVLFVAELTNGEHISKTRELWTFERDTKSRDPNWRLADVSVG